MSEAKSSAQIIRIMGVKILYRLRFDREVRLFPCIPAADQRSCFGPSGLSKFLRHTGAGSFVWSSTVGNQPGLLRKVQFLRLYYNVLGRHANGAFSLRVARVATSFRSHVE